MLPSLDRTIQATVAGELAVVSAWLSDAGNNADATDGNRGVTLLMLASGNGHGPIVGALLERGAAVDLQDATGFSALMFAASNYSSQRHLDVVQRLLRGGAKIGLREQRNLTALQLAESNGHSDCVQAIKTHLKTVAAEAAKRHAVEIPSVNPTDAPSTTVGAAEGEAGPSAAAAAAPAAGESQQAAAEAAAPAVAPPAAAAAPPAKCHSIEYRTPSELGISGYFDTIVGALDRYYPVCQVALNAAIEESSVRELDKAVSKHGKSIESYHESLHGLGNTISKTVPFKIIRTEQMDAEERELHTKREAVGERLRGLMKEDRCCRRLLSQAQLLSQLLHEEQAQLVEDERKAQSKAQKLLKREQKKQRHAAAAAEAAAEAAVEAAAEAAEAAKPAKAAEAAGAVEAAEAAEVVDSEAAARAAQGLHDLSLDDTAASAATTPAAAAADHAEEPKQSAAPECIVCLDAKNTHAFVPCGHVCACGPCGERVMASTGLCPYCRGKAMMVMQLYMPQ